MSREAIEKLNENDRVELRTGMHVEGFWMMVRLLVDMVGSEKAIEQARPHLRNGGQAFAINMKNMFGIERNDIEAIDEVTSLYDRIVGFGYPIEIEHSKDRIVRIGKECPYSGAPKEACVLAHETGYQAICEQINPDYTCRFSQMVTKGDPICSWVIEKKK
jgi:hypothetical protein